MTTLKLEYFGFMVKLISQLFTKMLNFLYVNRKIMAGISNTFRLAMKFVKFAVSSL